MTVGFTKEYFEDVCSAKGRDTDTISTAEFLAEVEPAKEDAPATEIPEDPYMADTKESEESPTKDQLHRYKSAKGYLDAKLVCNYNDNRIHQFTTIGWQCSSDRVVRWITNPSWGEGRMPETLC